MSITSTKQAAGIRLAELLGITIIGTEGHDLKAACRFCQSSDAARIHEDTGAYYCYSCQKALSGFDLSKILLGDHDAAIQIMRDVGLFDTYMSPTANGHAKNGKSHPSGDELLAAVASAKHCTVDGLRAFGAEVQVGKVAFPMWGPDRNICSQFFIAPDNGKGMNAKGRPTGLFFPGRSPDPGESWCIVEGVKDASVLHDLGYLAAGLPTNRMNKKFAPLFQDADVTIVPDADEAGVEGAKATAEALDGIAHSIKIARLPCEVEASGGYDVRDILREFGERGPDAIRRAIDEAVPAGGPPIEPPRSLAELKLSHPNLRPAVVDGLLRAGETMNVVSYAKRGKSWLVNSLALSAAAGLKWLDTFSCTQGRVLIIDAELHPETIGHRLPAVADAMGLGSTYDEMIDIWPLRGLGVDLVSLEPRIEAIEPNRYILIILDAWYRFLPEGISENDNADIMKLYNRIDAYAARLGAAWVNVHHTSKGDQSGKITTDVGSGAGSQSRAADTHLVIRQHEDENVAVLEAAVRSWPPVSPIAIRWTYPTWELDTAADPRKLRGLQSARERAARETKDLHLDEDRNAIVSAMTRLGRAETLSFIRDSSRIGNPRFGCAWASLLNDTTITTAGEVKKANGQRYETFVLQQEKKDS